LRKDEVLSRNHRLQRAGNARFVRTADITRANERLLVKRPALLFPALALTLGLIVSGCGSDAISKDDFVTKANKICADGDTELATASEEVGDAPSEEDLEAFVTDTVVPNIQDQHDAIEDLGAPEGDEDAVDDMLSGLQDGIEAIEADPVGMLTADSDPFADANAAADELGLTDCGSE
jgi:hypothetical protein